MDSTLRLIIENGPREGETLEFKSGTVIRIGRLVRGNTLAIKDPGISSKHLTIQFLPQNSQWFLSDLHSSNGTILNGNKLNSTEPAYLTDGATIKLGELTSIKLQIHSNVTSQLRRNPMRGGAAKRGKQETVKSEQDSELGFGDNKEQNGKAVKKPPRPRGRPKKEAVIEEIPESSCNVVAEVEELSNVLPKQGRQVCTRRTRNSKEEVSSNLRESDELVQFANPRTHGCGTRKRNLQVDEELGENCSKAIDKNSPNKDNIRDDRLETLGEEFAQGLVRSSVKETLGHKQLEDLCDKHIEASEKNSDNLAAKRIETSEKNSDNLAAKRNEASEKNSDNLAAKCIEASEKNSDNLAAAEKVEKPDEPCAKELEENSNVGEEGTKDSGADIDDSQNLESMTLGEWFDYIEMALPKEIHDATEEMVAGLRKKEEQFHEFMLQHKKAEAKAPIE